MVHCRFALTYIRTWFKWRPLAVLQFFYAKYFNLYMQLHLCALIPLRLHPFACVLVVNSSVEVQPIHSWPSFWNQNDIKNSQGWLLHTIFAPRYIYQHSLFCVYTPSVVNWSMALCIVVLSVCHVDAKMNIFVKM